MAQTNQTTPSLADALSPENIANPYPLYRQMREIDPVYWDERVNSWVLTTYAHNVSALRDTRFSATGFMAETAWIPEELRATLEPPIRALTRQMLFLDPPDHTRLPPHTLRAPWHHRIPHRQPYARPAEKPPPASATASASTTHLLRRP